jgi:hypothetical protein
MPEILQDSKGIRNGILQIAESELQRVSQNLLRHCIMRVNVRKRNHRGLSSTFINRNCYVDLDVAAAVVV